MGRGAARLGRLAGVAGLCLPIARPAAGALDMAAFAPRVSIAVGGGAIGLAGGDFNGDGRRDLAVGNNNVFQATVLYGQSDGTLGTPATLTSASDIPLRMTAGDLNGDGRSDLVYNDSGFSVAYGQLSNSFSPIDHFAQGGFKYAIADLNGDGRQDIATTYLSVVLAYFGQAGGGFALDAFAAGQDGRGIAVRDLNGDGRADIIVTNRDTDQTLTVMTALAGGGYLNTTLPGGGRPESVITADFNHDGRPDVAFPHFSNGAGIKLAQAGGGFSGTTFFDTTDSALDITSGDFNHDGHADLAMVTVNHNTVSLLLGNGDGSFAPATNLFASANGSASVLAGDFNGDGWDDLAVASASGPNVDLFYQIPEPGTAISGVLVAASSLIQRRRRA